MIVHENCDLSFMQYNLKMYNLYYNDNCYRKFTNGVHQYTFNGSLTTTLTLF